MLNNETSFQYKVNYIFDDHFRFNVEYGEEIGGTF